MIFQGPLDGMTQNLGVQGLGQVIEGPELDGLHGVLITGKPGEHNYQGIRVIQAEILHQFHASHLRHDHIGDDQIIGVDLERRHGFLAVGRGIYQVSGGPQDIFDQLQDGRFIIDYQNNRLLFHA